MLKNRVMKQQSRSFESTLKARAIADVNIHCKMTSVITLDGVTWKTLQIHVYIHAKQFNYCRNSSVQWRKVGRMCFRRLLRVRIGIDKLLRDRDFIF